MNDSPPIISYGAASFTLTKQAAAQLTATNSGGAVVTWSINPVLPGGLTFSTTDGSINGTPAATARAANYVVTASNSGGSTTVNLKLAVQSVLLNLGHNSQISLIRLAPSRVLSHDGTNWVLWDQASAAMIATGGSACVRPTGQIFPLCPASPLVDMTGSIVVIEILGGLELRSASDGSLIARLSDSTYTWWKLATDGSYIAVGGTNGLTVWSATGTSIASRTGDYSSAQAFAAPGAVRVAVGPAGADVIESISLPAGSSTITPAFQGTFNTWFQDGGQFLANTGNTVWVYAADGTQEEIAALPSVRFLGGQGGWFWSYDSLALSVYQVGSSATPVASFAIDIVTGAPIPSGTTIGVLENALGGSPVSVSGVVHIIDLSGATPVMVDHTTPAYHNSAYAALSGTEWFVGNDNGTLLDGASLGGTLKYFGYGRTWAVAAGGSRAAVATVVGKVLVLDATTGAIEEAIDAFDVSGLAMSRDGSVLVTAITDLDTGLTPTGPAVQVYTLPGANLIYSSPSGAVTSFSLNSSGSILAWLGNVIDLSTQTSIFTTVISNPIRLSPDGTLIAITQNATTNIYLNGTLVTAVPGSAVGWLDNTHLLIELGTGSSYSSSVIVNQTGVTVNTPTPHDFEDPVQILGLDSIYDVSKNTIFSVSTGTPTWTSETTSIGLGAVATSSVVFVSGNLVISEPL